MQLNDHFATFFNPYKTISTKTIIPIFCELENFDESASFSAINHFMRNFVKFQGWKKNLQNLSNFDWFFIFFLNFRDFYENAITKFECISKPYLITRVESSQKIAKQLRNKQSKTNYFLQTVTLQGKANPRLRASASARLGFYELGKNSVLAPRTL